MTKPNRYTNARKMATVLLADQTSQSAAAEATGVPRKTLAYWMDRPEFANLRHRAREAVEEETIVAARRGWGLIVEKMPFMEPRDLINATVNATEKALLMTGEATTRSEHRDITDVDADGVAALEGLLAGSPWEVPAGVEHRGNGAGKNGKH